MILGTFTISNRSYELLLIPLLRRFMENNIPTFHRIVRSEVAMQRLYG